MLTILQIFFVALFAKLVQGGLSSLPLIDGQDLIFLHRLVDGHISTCMHAFGVTPHILYNTFMNLGY